MEQYYHLNVKIQMNFWFKLFWKQAIQKIQHNLGIHLNLDNPPPLRIVINLNLMVSKISPGWGWVFQPPNLINLSMSLNWQFKFPYIGSQNSYLFTTMPPTGIWISENLLKYYMLNNWISKQKYCILIRSTYS